MNGVSDVVAVNSDGTALLAGGRVVRLVVGRHNILGVRDVDPNGLTTIDYSGTAGLDQIGKTPVPTMAEALGG